MDSTKSQKEQNITPIPGLQSPSGTSGQSSRDTSGNTPADCSKDVIPDEVPRKDGPGGESE